MTDINEILRDKPVREELFAWVGEGRPLPDGPQWDVDAAMVRDRIEGGGRPPSEGKRPFTEAVIRRFARPVLLIRNNKIELPKSKEMRNRVSAARPTLEPRLSSVGRVEMSGHPSRRWAGTGWVIAENVIVTNRHIAELFARPSGRGFTFRLNDFSGEKMMPRIDFREEYRRPRERALSAEVAVTKILFMEADSKRKPDVAFLLLDKSGDNPPPIPIGDVEAEEGADMAIVGYPARDPGGVPNETAAHKIFGNIYEVKRLSPGKVMKSEARDWYFAHDATTLGGNSGSVALDFETGAAVGLHFWGELESANYAVKAKWLLNYLGKLRLRSSITAPGPVLTRPREPQGVKEGKPEDYDHREGFDPTFLGSRRRVDLPKKTVRVRDVLTFSSGGRRTSELKYTHFSVAMSRSRKLCIWSAVNIDGKESRRRIKRPDWRFDPRIPKDAQTSGEVYGREPQFSRGHMTRREDPIWGPIAVAKIGNSDSMHLTNAVPQMQPFNAGIWLGLEDYALENAREDDMRISVFTGPVLSDEDSEMYGVQIPVMFWKVIAFVHDKTNRLCATGYTMSQESFLTAEEFVYGEHDTAQRPIKWIEKVAGLSFGSLTTKDPKNKQRNLESVSTYLTDFEQIEFV